MDLRRKLIREVLDSDKEIIKRASYIQFKNVPKNEVALLHHQMDPEEAQKLGICVSSLRKTLEHKNNSSKMLLSSGAKHTDKHIMNLCGVEEVITMHNYIVSVYRKMGHSNQTRVTMKSIFASLEGDTQSIVRNMKLAVGRLTRSPQMSPFLHAMRRAVDSAKKECHQHNR